MIENFLCQSWILLIITFKVLITQMEKINKLRKLFKQYNLDGYLIPKNDEFFSRFPDLCLFCCHTFRGEMSR